MIDNESLYEWYFKDRGVLESAWGCGYCLIF